MNESKAQSFDTAHMAAAWDWVLRLQDEAVSQEDLAEWLRWYEADEQHKEAFDDMQAFWQQIDRVTEEPNPLSADLWLGPLAMSKATAAQLLAPELEPGLVPRVKRFFSRLFPSPRVLSWAGPGLAFALCVAVALRLLQSTPPPCSGNDDGTNAADCPGDHAVRRLACGIGAENLCGSAIHRSAAAA